MNFLELFSKKSLIAAHRGASSEAPENTLLAMKKSVGHCDFIEIDVQLSSDGIAVVMHDKTLERTTNAKELAVYKSRSPYKVSDFTFDELSILDFGDGEKLLTLKRALEFIKENSLYLNIEIKDTKENFSDEKTVSTLLDEIKEIGVESQVLISSFRPGYLSLVKSLSPKIATALLADNSNHENLIEYLNGLGVDAYHINKKLVNKDLINKLRTEGFFVNVYLVNDIKEQKKLFDMGVSAVFSNLNTKNPPKFIADCHLGKLAKYLRVMGFDTLFFSTIDDNDLIELAKEQGRIILTRDRILHERKKAPTFYLKSIDNLEQLQELQVEYKIKEYSLSSRCVVCNTLLKSVEKSKIENQIPQKVKKYFSEFEICNKCERVYWRGDHYRRMMLTINAI